MSFACSAQSGSVGAARLLGDQLVGVGVSDDTGCDGGLPAVAAVDATAVARPGGSLTWTVPSGACGVHGQGAVA